MRWKIEKRTDPDLVAHIIKLRGITDKENYLNPSHPSGLTTTDVELDNKALSIAVNRVNRAVKKDERIVVYGDYDVDGVSGTAILWETLNRLGANVLPYIPDRKTEGYGFSVRGIEQMLKQHSPNLVVSVDHGITAGDEVAYLVKEGVDVIVTDHHQPSTDRKASILQKNATAIVHTTQLSGAGIAWYLASTLAQQHDDEQLGLAAFGTVADVVRLICPNRSIVRYGLDSLTNTNRVGLQALKQEAGISNVSIEPYHIGYILGPRINAVGRLEHALDALRLLCTSDRGAAEQLARKLSAINHKRQKLLEKQLNYSLQHLRQAKELPTLLILADEMYEEGIIGLIAGKLVDRYWRPAIVIAKGKDGKAKASARSIPGVNIIALIRKVENLLLGAGGHPLAAGFTLEAESIETVAEQLMQIAQESIDKEQLMRELAVDAEIEIDEATRDLYSTVKKFAPFGAGNPEPLFCTRGVFITDVRTVGVDGKHLKFRVGDLEAIAFGKGYLREKLSPTEPIDIAYHLNLNHWNGREILQLKVRDIRQE